MNKEQGFVLLVLAAAAATSFYIVLPILEFVLMAIILAYMLHPVNRRVEPYLGHRLAPAVVIIVALVVLLLPILYALYVVYRDLEDIAAAGPDLEIEAIETWIADTFGYEVALGEPFENASSLFIEVLFGDLPSVLSTLTFVAVGLVLMVFVLYYLLRDGRALVRWLLEIAPVGPRVGERLVEQLDKTTYGVIVGHLLVAIIEAILGGLAFWVVGIPNVFFWAFVMLLVSLLPIIGAFLIWAPGVGYLVLIEEPFAAFFLFLWGAIVITLVDDWVRPIVVDREAHLNPAIILIGVFGGIYSIGATGLFVGPIILGVLVAAMKVFDEEWDSIGES